MKAYPLVDDLLPPILRVAMPRAGRLYTPGGTVHVVARGNNREFCFTSSEDFERLVALPHEMLRTYPFSLKALLGNSSSTVTPALPIFAQSTFG